MNGYVHASEKDNLVTCVRPMKAGEIVLVDGREITVRDGGGNQEGRSRV